MRTPLRRYYRGHTLATMRDVQAGHSRHYHFDHQGTVQCLTDQTGAVTDRFASDAWGVQVKRTGTSINRHWYIGNLGYYRSPIGAVDYVRARYLKAAHGMWMSRDPEVLSWSLDNHTHLYGYGSGNPALRMDASGRVPELPLNVPDIKCNRGVVKDKSTGCNVRRGF